MPDVPYYKPPEEGPLFPEDGDGIGDEFEAFLRASDRDVVDDVEMQNIRDLTERSYRSFADNVLKDMFNNKEQELFSADIARILGNIGEEYGFDAETCSDIAALPFEEAFETAYGYLQQAGLDADEILLRFM